MIKLSKKTGYYWINYRGKWLPVQIIKQMPSARIEAWSFRYGELNKKDIYEIGDEIKIPEK